MSELSEIVNQDQIKLILRDYTGEKQLLQLKFYLLQYHKELKAIGVDPANLAWSIYKTNRK